LQHIEREFAARDGIRPNVRGRKIDIAIGHSRWRTGFGRGDLQRGALMPSRTVKPHVQVGAPRPGSVANLNFCLFRPLRIRNRIGRENSSGIAPQSGTGLSTPRIDCSAILTIG
jgi:hypothetical protein